MTDNDNKRKLYDALSEDYDMGTFEQFSTDVEDEGKRKKLYDAIKGDYDMPDFDEFSQQLVGVRQETKPVATTPQKGGGSESSSVYQAPTSRTASYNYGGSVPESVYAQKNQAKNQEQRPQQTQQAKQATAPKATAPTPNYQVPSSRTASYDYGGQLSEEQVKAMNKQTRQAKANETKDELANLSNNIEQMVEDATQKVLTEARQKEESKGFWGRMGSALQRAESPSKTGGIEDLYANNPEIAELEAARRLVRDAKRTIAEADHNANGGFQSTFVAGAGRGFGQKVTDVDTWDFGITDMKDNAALLSALDAAEKGKKLTPSQQALLDAKTMQMAADMYFGSEVGRGYKAGSVTAESLPFMLEMMINPAAGIGNSLQAKMIRYATKRFGLKAVEKGGRRYAAKQVMGAAGRVVGDVVGASAMTATTGSIRTTADAFDRMNNAKLNGEDLSMGKAFAKAFAGTAIENYSEMFGAYFEPVLGATGKVLSNVSLSKFGKTVRLDKIRGFIQNVNTSEFGKIVNDFEKNTKWNGMIGEYSEEVAGGIMNALIVGDQTLDNDPETGVFNLSNNIDTFLGVSLMGGFFSAVKTAGYRTPKYRAKQAVKDSYKSAVAAFGGDESGIAAIRDALEGGNVSDVNEVLADVCSNPQYSEEQRRAVLEYANKVVSERGVEMYDQKRQSEGVEDDEDAARYAFDNGYDAAEQERRDITIRVAMGDETEESKAQYEGMRQRIEDDADTMAAGLREQNAKMSHSDGSLHPVLLKELDADGNGIEAYIVDGNVAMDSEGGVDASNSDRSIVIYDTKSGERRMIDPAGELGISSVGEVVSAEQMEQNIAEARAQYVQQQLDDASGKVKMEVGQTVTVPGTDVSGTVVAVSEDGEGATVQTEDGAQVPVMLQDVQNEADEQAMADYEERHANEAEQQPEGETPGTVVEQPDDDEMPMMEDGEANFLATTPERGRRYIYDEAGLTSDEAGAFVAANISEAEKALKKLQGKAPKMGTSIQKYQQEKESHQQQLDQAQQVVDYWNGVKAEQQKILAEEMRRRAEQDNAAREAAILAEQQRQVEELAKREAQAQLGSNAVASQIKEKWDVSPKIEGNENEITLPGGEKVKGRYVLVESGAATPSHNPNMEFARNEGFPVDENGQTVNDRDYERDKNAQQITRDMADRYDSRAVQNVPVVSQDGVVLSGNGRTMAGELAAQNGTDGAYVEHLRKYPQQFGFTPEQVGTMQHPRVVFVPDEAMPYTTDTFAKFNAQDMKSQSRTEQSVKLGKTVDDATFGRIVSSINGFDTLGDFYNDPKAAIAAIGELNKAGVINQMQMAEMMDGEKISGIGRQMLENMLIGKAFESNPDAVRQLSEYPSMRQSVVSALAEVANNIKLGEEYSLESEMAQAIDLAYQARKSGTVGAGEKVSAFARQGNLFAFDEGDTVADYTNATVMMLADCINDNRVNQLKKVLSLYNDKASDSAAGQYDLFSGVVKTNEQIINEVLNILNYGTEQEQKTALEGATERRKGQSVQENGTDVAGNNAGSGETNSVESTGNISEVDKWFGPVYTQFEGKANEAEAHLREVNNGVAKGALTYPGIYPIDLVWGDMTAGYMKILIKHPEVVGKLQEILSGTTITSQSDNRIVFESDTHKMIVSRMKGSLPTDNWLLTAYEKKEKPVSASSSDIETEPNGKRNGTATPQNGAISDGKDTNISETEQEKVSQLFDIKDSPMPEGMTERHRGRMFSDMVDAYRKSVMENPIRVFGYTTEEQYAQEFEDFKNAYKSIVGEITYNDDERFLQAYFDYFNKKTSEAVEKKKVQDAIASAEAEVDTDPTEGQKKAGNYKMGHVTVDGYDITIENPKGSVRRGTDPSGKAWEQEMHNTYGYIRGTEGVDGDHIDVFLSDDPTQGDVFVVDQVDPKSGEFDEHKVMYGFTDAGSAKAAYLSNYEEGWKGLGTITHVSKEEFKKWVESSHRKTKPFSEYSSVAATNKRFEEEYRAKVIGEDISEGREFGFYYTDKGRKQYHSRSEADTRIISKADYDYAKAHGGKMFPAGEQQDIEDDNEEQQLRNWFVQQWPHRELEDVIAAIEASDNPLNKQNLPKLKRFKELWDGSHERTMRRASGGEAYNTAGEAAGTVEVGDQVIYNGKKYVVSNINKDFGDVRYEIAKTDDSKSSQVVKPNEISKVTEEGEAAGTAAEEGQGSIFANHEVDVERSRQLRQSLVEAYRGGNREAIQQAVKDIKRYLDEGKDFESDYTEDVEDYEGNEPEKLADRYITHALHDRYLDDDEDQGYIKTGVRSDVEGEGGNYTITPKQYTTKKGKVLDMHLVKFSKNLDAKERRAVVEMAKAEKGWWSREDGGFLMRSEESAKMLAESVMKGGEAVEDAQPLTLAEVSKITDTLHETAPKEEKSETKTEAETKEASHEKASPELKQEAKQTHKWVDDEDAERFEELRQRMRKKMLGQMNMGVDPEILSIGIEMSYYVVKHGARVMRDYAKQMIEALGDEIRPYLKAFYNGVRDMPEMEGMVDELTPYEEVRTFDVMNFDKEEVKTDVITLADAIVKENNAEAESAQATEKLKKQRNDKRKVAESGAEPQYRPATEEDLSNGPLYYDGKPVYVMMVVHKGEQVDAQHFSEPEVESVYLTNGKNVKLEELSVLELPTKSERKVKKAPSHVQTELFNETAENNENEKVQLQSGTSTAERERGHEPRQNEPMGTGEQNEVERADRGRVAGRSGNDTMSDTERGGSVSGATASKQDVGTSQREEAATNPKNTNNNHAEPGMDYAPKGEDARIEANIKAIETMQRLLDSGEQATKEDKEILRRFSGWGGLGKAFNENPGGAYGRFNPVPQKLKSLLGDEGYAQAEMSRNSAYYTPASVIGKLWDVVGAMGFKGGKILEGSAGIGNIIGLMPRNISERSDIHAVEIDTTTGNILKLLYPDAQVDINGFEATRVENGSVDLAITNVPFVTGLRVNDTTGDKDLSKKFKDIHDFCIAKNIRKLREGGIGVFITSSGTLDNSAKLREWIISEGNTDVVGAFRMNNKTFGGTGATSDIIVVRKRVNGQKSPNAIDVLETTGERTVDYETGETKRVKGEIVDIVKPLSMDYNRYFVEHPEMMGGVMRFGFEQGDSYRPTSKGLYPSQNKDQAAMLSEWAKGFSEKDWETAPKSTKQNDQELSDMDDTLGVKVGTLLIDSKGRLCIAEFAGARPLEINSNKVKGHTKQECLSAYISIKDALRKVLEYQTQNEDDKGLQPLLDELNRTYDVFVKDYGHLHKNTSISFLKNDVDFANILALESFSERPDVRSGKRIQEFGKTDIFRNRVVEKEKEPDPTNVKDGIIASLYVHGRVNVPWIAEMLSKHSEVPMTEEQVREEIVNSGVGFEDPVTRQMEVSYEYLSGNVREKVRQAQENNQNGRYDKNIKALESVVPMNIPSHLIDFSIGSSWIDPQLYEDYVKEKTDVSVTFKAAGGTWFMKKPSYLHEEKNQAMGVRSEMLHKIVFGTELIEAAMTNKTIVVSETRRHWDGTTETVTDKDATSACANKIDEIRQDFKDWAREKMQKDAPLSEKIEREYNETFNNYVPKSIPDDFVPSHFGGAATMVDGKPFSLRAHQGKAVVRGTTQPLLLAHEVGTGKTYTLITTAMEMRRIGTARKPMIVVQNATVGQFVESAKKIYPNAKILTIEDSDRTKEGRKDFYAKIKYNDWDMIVVPQSVFERIPDSYDRQMAFVQDKIDEKMLVLEQMREADPNKSSMIVKQAEREIEKLEEEKAELSNSMSERRKLRLAPEGQAAVDAFIKRKDEKKEAIAKQNAEVKAMEMLDRKVDEVEDFDDMGIDALLIDEAHEYKHLGFATAMQRGVKGVDPSYSKKAQGLFLKAQAVLEKNNGRNVIFATGTPISNTAAEIWTFMRYLMPADAMKEYGIYYFDDFVRNFGNLTQMLEFTTSGKFKENNRFAGYVNLPELVRIWSGVADTVLTNEAGGVSDKIPELEGGKSQDIYLPQTKALRSVMKYVKRELDAYDKMSGKQKKENSHIPLTMYGIAKAAAVDSRLVLSDAADEEQSKTNEAVRQTLKSLEETKEYKGTIAIFADNYQNKKSGFNLYEDIRQKLIDAGVPSEQIVVMKSGMSVKKKLEIFDMVNRGDVRVIMGSTFTLGTGVNIQERLHTLIHLDAPNRPMDYTQRNGRILRQGNLHKEMNKPVRVLRFGVEDSLDVTAYQRLKTKGAIADSIMNGKKMMENSMENRALEEEEDVFGDTVAQLSGSEYAMLKNQAEKDVRKYENKLKQYKADQTYCHNEIPRLESKIELSKSRLEQAKVSLSKVESMLEKQSKPTITVGKKEYGSIDAMGDFIKEQNKLIRDADAELRENPYKGQEKKLTVSIKIGGFDFDFTTDMSVDVTTKQGELFSAVRRKMTYNCEELGLYDVPVKQSLLREGLEDIIQNVATGNDFRERIEAIERRIAKDEDSLRQVKARDGKPFEFTKELELAHQHYDEYSELMKQELEEKEKKYAEMDAVVELAGDVAEAEEAEDEEEEMQIVDEEDSTLRNDTEAKQMATEAVMAALRGNAGLEVVMETQEAGQRKADFEDVEQKRIEEKFDRELQQQIDGTLPNGHIYQMGMPSEKLQACGVPNLPIQLNAARLKEKSSKYGHDFDLSDVKGLVGAINNPIAVFEYGKNNDARNIIIGIQKGGKNFLVGMFLNPNVKGNKLEINSIRNVFPKDTEEWVNWIQQGKLKGGDIKEIQALIDKQRINLADVEYLDLDSVAKILNNFDNPQVFEEEKSQGAEMLRPDGVVYGWSEGNRIHLTTEGINPNTPIHEYTHLWAKAVKSKNPKLWSSIVNLLKGTPEWEKVVNDKNYTGLTTDDAIASETLARISGRENAKRMEAEAQKMIDEADGVFEKANAYSLLNRMREAINRFWSWVGKNLFGIERFDSIEEVTDRVLYDLLNKTDLQLDGQEGGAEYSIVTDKSTIKKLEESPKITGYRNVVLNEDGTFGSPMASGLRSKGNGKAKTQSFELGKWEQAEEHPELATENGKIDLVKPDGKSVGNVDYNPYIHNRPNKVNRQFKQAWERPNLVYVETEIAKSDIDEGYKADKAAKSVGVHDWNGGKLILSRYDKPVRVVPWDEVADDWEKEFKERGVEFDIVPPALLPILSERGVEILPPHKGMGKECNDAYKEFLNTNVTDKSTIASRLTGKENVSRVAAEVAEYLEPDRLSLVEKRARDTHESVNGKIAGLDVTNLDDIERSERAIEKGLGGAFLTYYDGMELTDHPDVPEAVKDAFRDAEYKHEDIPVELRRNMDYAREDMESYTESEIENDAFARKFHDEAKKRMSELQKALFWYEGNKGGMTLAPEEFFDENGKYVGAENVGERYREGEGRRGESMTYEEGLKNAKRAGYTRAQYDAYIERTERNARKRIADMIAKLNLTDKVEVREDASGLEGRKANAKGWYDIESNKIVIVLDNHSSVDDIIMTILHEGIGHYGLRQLFGKRFDTFLDNVFENGDDKVRYEIVELSKKHGWNVRTATEEYLARLAEDKNYFYGTKQDLEWWGRIKVLFIEMLHKIGVKVQNLGDKLSDNELRYILWRSYQNLINPGRFRSLVDEAVDIAKQADLKVGEFEEKKEKPLQSRKWFEEVPTASEETAASVDEAFNAQIDRLLSGEMNSNEYITLGMPMGVLSNYMPNDRIILRQKVVTKAYKKHGISAESIKNLPSAIANPIFIFKSSDNTISVLTEIKSKDGNNVFVSIELGVEKQMGHKFLEVNDILTIHGRNVENIIKPIIENESMVYVNKEKAHLWLSSVQPNGQAVTNEELNSVAKIVKNFESDKYADNVMYRDGGEAPKLFARDVYERMMNSGMSQFKEAVQDSMLSLKKAYAAILGKTKGDFRIEDVAGYENAYLAENRMHSSSEAEIHAWQKDYMEPIVKAVSDLGAKDDVSYKELTDYMMAKHGLERNEVFSKRDAERAEAEGKDYDEEYDKNRGRDYAGLTALTGMDNVADAEEAARQMVAYYEADHDTTALWEAVNRATKSSLRKTADSGLMSAERHQQVRDMFEYYIPLQGFDSKVAEEVYAYMGSDGTLGYGTPIRSAKGRVSKADDPLATISMNGEAAIRRGNRNLMKQHFLRFVEAHPSDLVSVNDVWLRHNDVTDEWEQYFDAGLQEGDSAEEVAKKVEAFEQTMEQLAEREPDHYKKGRDLPNVPYRVLRTNDMTQHQVVVMRGGKTIVMTINGNPRAAQALNGLTNPDVFTEGVFGKAMNIGQAFNRQLSLFYTTRNPEFVLSNFLRDAIYSNSMTWVKEGKNYALTFHKNFGKMNPVTMGKLFAEWENGTLREKVAQGKGNATEKLFYDFMMNGGETGWTNMRDIEKHKKDLEKAIAREKSTSAKCWKALGGSFDLMNRSVENCARFAAFVTSREMGRSIERSVWDAKEVSVNFNKKGAGDKFLTAKSQKIIGKLGASIGGLGRGLYVFFNASLQGLNNIARATKRHPWKAAGGLFGTLFTIGAVIPLLSALIGGDDDDDDKNSYYNLPEYIRRSNLCFRWSKEMPWITIPLPIEYRAIYGLGELATGMLTGKERYSNEEAGKQFVSQLSQVLPLDFMEGGGGWHAFVPSQLKPFVEASTNKSWTGLPIYRDNKFRPYDPQWTRAYSSANQQIVEATRWLNEKTGGDEVTQGWIDWNPAKIEYMLKGYLGGYFTMYDRLQKTAETVMGDREFEWRNIPMASRVLKEGDERTESRKITNEYFNLLGEYKEVDARLKGYKKIAESDREDAIDYAQRIDFMHNSNKYTHYLIFDAFKPVLDAYYELGKKAEGEEKESLKASENALRKECVELIHSVDDGKDVDLDSSIQTVLLGIIGDETEDAKINKAAQRGLKRHQANMSGNDK